MLHGLSLDVAPGEVVALVGPSGGGKSSVVKLMLNLYQPTSGEVLLDGEASPPRRPLAACSASPRETRNAAEPQPSTPLVRPPAPSGRPVHEYEPAWFHCQVSVVGQEPTLFGRSVRRNVAYGLPQPPPSDSAAKKRRSQYR